MTSTIAGPNRIIESINVPFAMALVTKAYVCPIAVAGMTALIMSPSIVAGTLVVSKPLQKVTKKVDGNEPLALKVKGMPSAAGIP